jgi:hypothetical protein
MQSHRHPSRPVPALIAGLILALAGPAARAELINTWNEQLVAIMAAEKTNAPMQSRNFALMHAAMFDAANAVEHRYAPYHAAPSGPAGASPEAAAASAAHDVLVSLYPRQAEQLDATLARSLEGIPDAGRQAGRTLGSGVATTLLQLRSQDGSAAPADYRRPDGPTAWQPEGTVPPLTPGWGHVRPWVLASGDQFRPAAPPAPGSARFQRDFQEVRAIGGKASTERSAEQTEIARFWIPPGVPSWSPVARQLADSKNLPLVERARLFALLSMAAADAITACWDAKYTYAYLRPVAAIRNGLGSIPGDPAWEPAVPTPPFPAYVSGHACFAGAARTVLEAQFGTGPLARPVSLTSASVPGMTRSYGRIADIVEEINNARVWGGIHWRTDQDEGEVLGRQVGRYVLDHALAPASVARR